MVVLKRMLHRICLLLFFLFWVWTILVFTYLSFCTEHDKKDNGADNGNKSEKEKESTFSNVM